jgi:cytochrome P450
MTATSTQLQDVATEPLQLDAFGLAQPVRIGVTVSGVTGRLDPVAQRAAPHPQTESYLVDRAARSEHQLHGVTLELRRILRWTTPWTSLLWNNIQDQVSQDWVNSSYRGVWSDAVLVFDERVEMVVGPVQIAEHLSHPRLLIDSLLEPDANSNPITGCPTRARCYVLALVVDLFAPLGDELHAALRLAADQGPLTVDATTGATIVLRHGDVEGLARDPRLAGVGLTFFDVMGIADGPLREWYGRLMFTNEGVIHDRLRRLVSRAFTPRSVELLRKDAAELATEALRPAREAGGADLVQTFALVAMRVMCRLLGVPAADVAVFGAWADALSPVFGFMDPGQITAATDAIGEMRGYVEALADRRRGEPADDLVSALISAEDEGDRLTHDELLDMVANLLVGGHDTTTSQIGCSLLTILRHPEEAERVRNDGELIVSAVEETIRFEPSIIGVPRTAIEHVTVAGTDIGPASILVLCTAAANRQPDAWDDPDRFDAGRFTVKGGPRLLSFGAGPHFCLGAALARMTVQECVRATLDFGPELNLTEDPASLPWRSVLGRSPARLPVAAA